MSDKSFSAVYFCFWSFRYLDQSLLTGFHGKSTVTVVKHACIWNQSTKQNGQRLADCLFDWDETRSKKGLINTGITV
jgi:hypothetical protein